MIEYIKEAKTLLRRKGDRDMERDERLTRLYIRVYSKEGSVRCLKLLGSISVVYVVLAFLTACALVGFRDGLIGIVRLITVSAIPFFTVSLMRLFLDFKRPYELIDFEPFEAMRKERKMGKSFPSRHVFSAFLIGVLLIPVSVSLGILTLIVGSFIAIERVLLGIHFTKDVVVGAIIGVLCGIIGTLFL